jgi:alpha-beta hydrolase superfamily lysophospholipase
LLAAGDALVATRIRERVAASTLVPAMPPGLPYIGVGHSMGACLTTMIQADAAAYDAVALLGYRVRIANVNDL